MIDVDGVTACEDVLDEVGCLARGRSVADGDGLNLVFADHLLDGHRRLHALVDRRVGEDGLVVEQIALCIEAHDLAACAEAWVDAHDALLSERGSQKELA